MDSRDAEKTYNLHSLDDLKILASGIPWSEYITSLGKGEKLLEWNVVMMPSFFEGFAGLVSEENLEAMKDALRVDLIRGYAPYLSNDLVAERFDFYGKKLNGRPDEQTSLEASRFARGGKPR